MLFDDYLWKSYVYRTTFSKIKYQDLCATINPSKINYITEYINSEHCTLIGLNALTFAFLLKSGVQIEHLEQYRSVKK